MGQRRVSRLCSGRVPVQEAAFPFRHHQGKGPVFHRPIAQAVVRPYRREGPAIEPLIAVQHLGLPGPVRVEEGHADNDVLRQPAPQVRREPLALLPLRPDGGVLIAAAVSGIELRRHTLHILFGHGVRLEKRLADGGVRIHQGRAVVGGDGALLSQQLLHPAGDFVYLDVYAALHPVNGGLELGVIPGQVLQPPVKAPEHQAQAHRRRDGG